jgi:two-component system response regulator YesN
MFQAGMIQAMHAHYDTKRGCPLFKVLLVDDEPFVRMGLHNLIDWHASGFEIAGEASNGEEAYEWILNQLPDLVISDIRMPLKSGLELVENVKAAGLYNVAFIFLSGYDDFKFAQLAVRHGVFDYLLKPIDEEELQAALARIAAKFRSNSREPFDAAGGRMAAGALPVHMTASEDQAPLSFGAQQGTIHHIRSYVEAHFREEISLKRIASAFYMNPVYIGQLFRRTYGVLFNEFLLGLRIREAKRLLLHTDMLVYEIAERVGFNSPNYFVAQFEKLERMTPSQYRSRHRAEQTGKAEAMELEAQQY